MGDTDVDQPVVLGSDDGRDDARRALARAVLVVRPELGSSTTPVVCPVPGIVEVGEGGDSAGGGWNEFVAQLSPSARSHVGWARPVHEVRVGTDAPGPGG